MELCELRRTAFVLVEDDVVAFGRSGPEADDGARGEPFLLDDARQHFLRVVEEIARRLARLRIVEDQRIAADQFPGLEERRPVDQRRKLAEVIGTELPQAEEFRLWRRVVFPVEFETVRAGLRQREALARRTLRGMARGYLLIFAPHIGREIRPLCFRKKTRRDAHGA